MNSYPFIFSEEKKYRVRRHVYFWLFWWMFQGILYSFSSIYDPTLYWKRLTMSMVESLVFMMMHIFLAYSLIYFVIPLFLLKQRYWHTAIWTGVLFLLTAAFSATIGAFIIDPLRKLMFGGLFIDKFRSNGANIFLSLMAGLRGAITIGGIAAAIKLMKYWYVKEQRNMQLQKENVESQLQLLKAQVHPHFLFNTLNNIYSYTQHTSPVASRLVTGLSDMLRFILYEGSQPLVPFFKELKMIQDYIELEQIRYDNKPDIHVDLPPKADDLYIAPLLLLPLIENCFKHGASNMIEQPWISLQIRIHDKQMSLKLLNGKANMIGKENKKDGIGLNNVKKRLALLYPGKHFFNTCNEEEVFVVNLKLELQEINPGRNNISIHHKMMAYE
ncbi:MAG: histidine kinase [Ginsengibacter sp.]